MLQIGNGTLTFSENRAHMIMWAVLNAPLMAGNDLLTMSDEVRQILTHPGLIAVNQDWGGRQGRLVATGGDLQVWEKPMSDGTTALAFLNRGERAVSVKATVYAEATRLTDVWSGDGASAGDALEVEPHGAVLAVVS
jgi:alpha-galactosidase